MVWHACLHAENLAEKILLNTQDLFAKLIQNSDRPSLEGKDNVTMMSPSVKVKLQQDFSFLLSTEEISFMPVCMHIFSHVL